VDNALGGLGLADVARHSKDVMSALALMDRELAMTR
jgi:hypothetical protein